MAAGVRVVVAVEHQVDVVALDGLGEGIAVGPVVPGGAGVVDRLVEHDDRPLVGVGGQGGVQELALLVQEDGVGHQRDDAHPAPIDVVRGVAQDLGAVGRVRVVVVVRRGERVDRELVVADGGQQRRGRGLAVHRGVPVAPLPVQVGLVDHVAGLQDQLGVGNGGERGLRRRAPFLRQPVLGVAEKEHVDGAGVDVGRGAELAPRPGVTTGGDDAVLVGRGRGQIGHCRRLVDSTGKRGPLGRRVDPDGLRVAAGRAVLHRGTLLGGAERDGHATGGVVGRGQNDALGDVVGGRGRLGCGDAGERGDGGGTGQGARGEHGGDGGGGTS